MEHQPKLKPIIVGIYSSTPGCGKTTLAGFLGLRRFRILPFARPLKLMAKALLTYVLADPSAVQYWMVEGKNEVIPQLGASARELMQKLGTEWGREHFGEDFWVRIWLAAAQNYCNDTGVAGVVADDMRFLNEAKAIHEMDGILVRVVRPGLEVSADVTSHASEGGLDHIPFDLNLLNDTMESLETGASFIADGRVRRAPERCWEVFAEHYPQRQME